jgi:hypothetical protein
MKTCAYYGRENDSGSFHCIECGTEFVDPAPKQPSASQPRDWDWLRRALTYCGVTFGVMSLYLLSFGPVSRYCTTVTLSGPVTATTGNSTTVATTRTVQYSPWIFFIYYPASLFRDWGAYEQYLQWWEDQSRQK